MHPEGGIPQPDFKKHPRYQEFMQRVLVGEFDRQVRNFVEAEHLASEIE